MFYSKTQIFHRLLKLLFMVPKIWWSGVGNNFFTKNYFLRYFFDQQWRKFLSLTSFLVEKSSLVKKNFKFFANRPSHKIHCKRFFRGKFYLLTQILLVFNFFCVKIIKLCWLNAKKFVEKHKIY